MVARVSTGAMSNRSSPPASSRLQLWQLVTVVCLIGGLSQSAAQQGKCRVKSAIAMSNIMTMSTLASGLKCSKKYLSRNGKSS